MVVKTKKGYFQVLKNVKDAFNLEIFEECYIEEWYDQFIYIVGDISDSKLRLKGFSANPAAKEYFEYIPDYLIEASLAGIDMCDCVLQIGRAHV